eukprot:6550711-Prymnesium_polylepis.1
MHMRACEHVRYVLSVACPVRVRLCVINNNNNKLMLPRDCTTTATRMRPRKPAPRMLDNAGAQS